MKRLQINGEKIQISKIKERKMNVYFLFSIEMKNYPTVIDCSKGYFFFYRFTFSDQLFLAHLSWRLKRDFLLSVLCLFGYKLFTVSSSSPEPEDKFQPNLAQSFFQRKICPFLIGGNSEIAKLH